MSQVLAFIGGEDVTLDDAAVERAVAGVAAAITPDQALSAPISAPRSSTRWCLSLKADADAIVDEMTEESGCLTRRDMALELERTDRGVQPVRRRGARRHRETGQSGCGATRA